MWKNLEECVLKYHIFFSEIFSFYLIAEIKSAFFKNLLVLFLVVLLPNIILTASPVTQMSWSL